jgi:hypothetical protein
MTPHAFNGPLFAHDFVLALDRAQKNNPRHLRPHYNERKWWAALAEADEHDIARKLTSGYQACDCANYRTPLVRYYSHLSGDSIGKMKANHCACPQANQKSVHSPLSAPKLKTPQRRPQKSAGGPIP